MTRFSAPDEGFVDMVLPAITEVAVTEDCSVAVELNTGDPTFGSHCMFRSAKTGTNNVQTEQTNKLSD